MSAPWKKNSIQYVLFPPGSDGAALNAQTGPLSPGQHGVGCDAELMPRPYLAIAFSTLCQGWPVFTIFKTWERTVQISNGAAGSIRRCCRMLSSGLRYSCPLLLTGRTIRKVVTARSITLIGLASNGPLQPRRRVSADVGWKRWLADFIYLPQQTGESAVRRLPAP